MTNALQHHFSEQLSLGGVQQGPLFLGEVYSYIFKCHRFLQHGYYGSDRTISINVQGRRVDMAALSKGVETLGVQKDQTKFGFLLSWYLLFRYVTEIYTA